MKTPPQFVSKDDKDRALVTWATDILRAIRDLQAVPFMSGHLLETVAIASASPTPVKHKLGRVPLGYWIVSLVDNAVVWQPSAPNDTVLVLQADTDTHADVWVF